MSNNPTHKEEWKKLKNLSQEDLNLISLFDEDENRVSKLSFEQKGIFVDFSKQKINSEILENLLSLAKSSDIATKRDAMFNGDKINVTESRSVLHTALRRPKTDNIEVDGQNVISLIHDTLSRVEKLSEEIRNGQYKGVTGKPIKDAVCIGIGGSDLGPRMVYNALNDGDQPVNIHFVSNIDADDILSTLKLCDPETTLFIVISKSFSTQETITNAITAHEWITHKLKTSDVSAHFIAVSSNTKTAVAFGIEESQIYPIWDWVNGRFSVWSAIGLPIAIGLGFDVFKSLLDGAYTMDQHFMQANFEENIPVLLALIGIWNTNFLNSETQAILPYSQQLSHLPSYLQQLEMESNGKSVDLDGAFIKDYKTSPILFGEAGTNGQHSFYQLLHQGTHQTPCDFIGVINPNHDYQQHHNALMNHMLAQSQAMMQGRQIENLPRYFAGNIPSTTILLEKLDAYHLGRLIALYEHKVFVQGIIWNINSFDQFGVELGKEMAKNIENGDLSSLDPSTKALHSRIHKQRK